ncbi:uncharacterized protein LOC106473168 isoform X2 [Limulus polyphemus]|uniref:Uncharacterized protein LOC106473168 isoform X2 n=1 Tax=Limulus polyphemus TaxID=6850 RepID=A0ABM1TNB3_LIMPO|nr:uncharacterized protein LOC106473168 isoform X2 [Limulus polyphemus]
MKPQFFIFTLLMLCLVGMATAAPTVQDQEEKAENNNDLEPKEKRSEEKLVYGNQQNKPPATTDNFPKIQNTEDSESPDGENGSSSRTEGKTDKYPVGDESLHGKEQDKKQDSNKNLDVFGYMDTPSVLSVTNPYGGEPYGPESDGSTGSLSGTDIYDDYSQYRPYDYSDAIYRRKRSYMRKRNLKNNMDEMLNAARRFPRRAMRSKRHTDVEQILKWLNALSQEKQYEQVPYQDRRPFPINDVQNTEMMLPPEGVPLPTLYSNNYAYNSPTEEENVESEGMWRNPYKDIMRRSYLYPTDYRYFVLPSQKRSPPTPRLDDNGQWGQIIQRHQLYDTDNAEDLERLYALASLLSDEGSDREYSYRGNAHE